MNPLQKDRAVHILLRDGLGKCPPRTGSPLKLQRPHHSSPITVGPIRAVPSQRSHHSSSITAVPLHQSHHSSPITVAPSQWSHHGSPTAAVPLQHPLSGCTSTALADFSTTTARQGIVSHILKSPKQLHVADIGVAVHGAQ